MATPSRITSRQNQRVKDAVRLRSRRDRDRQGRCLVDGSREALRAIEAGVRCVEAFVCEPLVLSGEAREAVQAVTATDADVWHVTPEVYEKLCFGEREAGIVLVAETPQRPLAKLQVPSEPLVAVVEGVEKPGNLGAILRSADAAGVDAVIVADGRTDLFNPNTIRASLGTVFRENVCEGASAEVVAWLHDQRLTAIAARPDADTLYAAIDLRGGVAIVLGSEATGLSQAWKGTDVQAVRLPMHGLADSLNVSATAAVLFYEAVRQRGAR